MWIVVNHHPGTGQGSYLIAREDEGDADGEMKIIKAEELAKYRLVDFLEETEDFRD